MRLGLRSNVDVVLRDLDAFVEEGKTRAAARAVNVLQGQATIVGFRKIAQLYDVGPRTVEKYASVELATATTLEAAITVKGPGFPVYAFKPIVVRGVGVSARIKGKRVMFPGAFIARMPNGHVGVFARGAYGGKGATTIRQTGSIGRFVLGRGKRVRRANKWGSSEIPINELYTFSPADTFANPDVVDAMMARVEEQAPIIMVRELKAIRRGF